MRTGCIVSPEAFLTSTGITNCLGLRMYLDLPPRSRSFRTPATKTKHYVLGRAFLQVIRLLYKWLKL